ncbi:hypothetical protein [Gimesia maris]|uniref:hypothetical protein n=1 Tax=Gimesia maris TaxID=122 RepID=UPI0032EB31F5
MNLFEWMVVLAIPAALFASVAASLSKGDKFIAFGLCFFFGPFGLLLLMAIEYAHTMPPPVKQTPLKVPKIRRCRKCNTVLPANIKECPGCKFPVQPV